MDNLCDCFEMRVAMSNSWIRFNCRLDPESDALLRRDQINWKAAQRGNRSGLNIECVQISIENS